MINHMGESKMKRLFLDCQTGIAGDMFTATLGLVDNPETWIKQNLIK